MAKIKNMGTATMRFKEGIIITGSAGTDTRSLLVTGSTVISGSASHPSLDVYNDISNQYVAIFDNDASSNAHGMKITTDGTGTGTNILDVESGTTNHFRIRGDGRVGIGKTTSLPAAVLTVSSSNTDSDIAIAHKIHHIGDSDTSISFNTDKISFEVGGNTELEIDSDISLDPNGSGVVIFKGNATKGAGQFKLNCENNSHGITIKGPPHSSAASYTLTLPNDDGNNNQVLKTDGAGVLSWDDQSGGSVVNTLNNITGATGDVVHDCTNSNFFYHTSIAGNFTPNFTELNMQNNQFTEGSLILTQGGTGYLPEAFKVDSTGSAIYWEWPGSSFFTASINKTDTIDFKITKRSDTYNIFARFANTIFVAAQGGGSGVSIPNNCLVFLDASDTNSYNGSGTTWTDLSGQNKHGTLVNTPTWNGTDKLFEFAGNSSQHITLPTGFADFTSGATFFFVADLGTGNHWERLVDFSGGSSTPLNVGRKQSTTTMKLEYYNPSKTGTESNIIQNSTLASYCVTTDGSYAKFYRNGSLITNNSYDKVPDNNDITQNYIVRFRSGGDAYYEGEIAVVAIFNRALTASEITDLHDHYDPIYSL